MNKLFHAFSIEVPGAVLDDVMFFDNTDYDASNTTTPTYENTVAKAKGFIRMKHLKRKLADVAVPIQCDVTYGTEGTASTLPSDTKIVVGYISILGFISLIPEEERDKIKEADYPAKAAEQLKKIVDEAIQAELTEFLTVRTLTERNKYTGIANPEKMISIDLPTQYINVEKSTVSSVVKYIDLSKD